LVRVGPNEVLTRDADAYRRICSVRSKFKKGPWYDAARVVEGQDSIFSMRDEKERDSLKTRLIPAVGSPKLQPHFSPR